MNLSEARRIIGTLSFESKMPGTGYSLPAQACQTGAKLAKIPGTACAGCYALKDRWLWPNPQKAMWRRLAAIGHPQWVEAMARLLNHVHSKPQIRVDLGATGVRLQRLGGQRWRYNEAGWHRWHGSGDLQSAEHFARICEVARLTPRIRHWLPTQELGYVAAHSDVIPDNLIVRVSAPMINRPARKAWPYGSVVVTGATPASAHRCPAPLQQHRCMSCRACWSKDVALVAYEVH